MTKSKLKTLLADLYPNAKDRQTSIEAWLVRLLYKEPSQDRLDWLESVVHHGCISGAVAPLIYYSDCVAFYNKFSEQIWQKIETFLDETGQTFGDFLNGFSTPTDTEVSFKTSLSWFAVEEAAHQLLRRSVQNDDF